MSRSRLSCLVFRMFLLLIAGLASGCGGIEQKLDNTIGVLKQTNKTFEEMNKTLRSTAENLDKGKYRDQVNEIADRASKVAQLGVQSSFDFARNRVVEDLENLKRSVTGEPPLERIPKLTNAGLSDIDRTSTSRTSVTAVGWNLDVAQEHQEKYKVRIENNDVNKNRDIDPRFVAYHGQYAVTIDVSSSGIVFQDNDRKLIFEGIKPVFELLILNTNPIVPERIISVSGSLNTTNQDREGGFCTITLMDGPNEAWRHTFPEYPAWPDRYPVPFAFTISPGVAIPRDPRFLVYLSQDGAKERSILWRFEAKATFLGNAATELRFDQVGLSLETNNDRKTVVIAVNRLR